PFNVTYPPNMIAEGVEEAVRGVQSGDTSKGRIRIIPAEIITPANAAEYYFPDSTY
ncbi:MAG: ABC transporter substrate-binding protein, partial [Lentisphaerae bacterium]|nr:ABC transporter substrate-binding protein [Lentisphaerota bacterium]